MRLMKFAMVLVVLAHNTACRQSRDSPATQSATATAPASAPAAHPASSLETQRETGLPTVGILLYENVLTTEVTAPLDVFTKHPDNEKKRFNVVTIAESRAPIRTEEGMRILPDFDFDTAPALTVLVIPSAYDMTKILQSRRLIEFVQARDKETSYTMSNCAGAQLVGESGIAEGRKIVTWVGGGIDLQKTYPKLKVQDDAKVTYVKDGKYISSNGNLASYISALELIEIMTTTEHRKFVESYLYLERLVGWSPNLRREQLTPIPVAP